MPPVVDVTVLVVAAVAVVDGVQPLLVPAVVDANVLVPQSRVQ